MPTANDNSAGLPHGPSSGRMDQIAPFEVMEVLAAARRLDEAGHDVIHLEVGEPDFPTPEPVVEAARAALSMPMGYTDALGLAALRTAISQDYRDRFGVDVDPGCVAITPGSSAGLMMAMGMALEPGNAVLMADPGYPCNRHFAVFVGGRPISVPTGPETRYQLTVDLLDRAVTPEVRAVMVASPSNPTGTTVPDAEMRAIAAWCRDRSITLIVDEIYLGLTYDAEPRTVLEYAPEALVISSFSKYFQMTGWRLGWMVVPPSRIREVERLAQNLYLCAPTPSQHAGLVAFTPEVAKTVEERRRAFAARRDALLDALPEGLSVPVRPDGAFYVYADVSSITRDSFSFARDLLAQEYVAVTPGRDFGDNRPDEHIRIAYTHDATRLREACRRIARFVGRWTNDARHTSSPEGSSR